MREILLLPITQSTETLRLQSICQSRKRQPLKLRPLLCAESYVSANCIRHTNEGYLGTVTAAPRLTHRFIRENFSNETWGWHYSPYAYFEEHAIFVNFKRQPMQMGLRTFTRLMQLRVSMYMVGSNADLPIVGGSITRTLSSRSSCISNDEGRGQATRCLPEYENVQLMY